MPGVFRLLTASTLILQCGGVVAATPQSKMKVDPVSGEQVYARCMACHSLTENQIGPKHCGVFGRRAGVVPGFDYSPAMRNAKIIWNEKALNGFLSDPMKYLPSTTMIFAGIPDHKERADVIAWLKMASVGSIICRLAAQR